MDCEKFESTMIDELYEELDELTLAAAKRHVAGCARCASMRSGLRATRRLVRSALPVVEPPLDLEDRILAATRDAQNVVPIKRRVSNAISWAGSWAMRPQTAMAALFLLMIGSSVLLLRGRAAKSPASGVITVSEQGAPVASAVTGTVARPSDLGSSSNAHGTPEPRRVAAAAPVAPSESLAAAPTAGGPGVGGVAKLSDEAKRGSAKDRSADEGVSGYGAAVAQNAAPPAPAAAFPAGGAPPRAQASEADEAAPAAKAGVARAEAYGSGSSGGGGGGSTDFDAAMASFRAGSFGDATRQFDAIAGGGNVTAALWAARSVREGTGCGNAVGRFDQVAARAFGTAAGYDATLEAGRCYRAMGANEAARARLVRLLTVQSHAARAQSELDAMAPKSMARPSGKPPQAAPAKPADVAY
jgi:hypothetical protein